MNEFLNIALGTAIIIAIFASAKPLRIAWLKWILKRNFIKIMPMIPTFNREDLVDVRRSLKNSEQWLPDNLVQMVTILLDTREKILDAKERFQNAIDEKKNSD